MRPSRETCPYTPQGPRLTLFTVSSSKVLVVTFGTTVTATRARAPLQNAENRDFARAAPLSSAFPPPLASGAEVRLLGLSTALRAPQRSLAAPARQNRPRRTIVNARNTVADNSRRPDARAAWCARRDLKLEPLDQPQATPG